MIDATLKILTDGRLIGGYCAPGFEGVLDAFTQNFEQRAELGASACLTVGSETKVDLWGGTADRKTGAAWAKDTISVVFSCTKGAAALCLHRLIEQGKIGLFDRVADIWPAFAQNGKQDTLVIHMLAHTSPVPHLRAPIRANGMEDFDYMTTRLEEEEAFWAPGTRQGYHGLTYAWTVGNLVRRVSSKPLGQYFAEEVAGPLGLDFYIGLPESEEGRVATMAAPDPAEVNFTSKFMQAVTTQPGSLSQLFLTNNGGADFNSRSMHAAEVASANGITNARGLAGLYSPLANGGGGLIKPETIVRMGRVSAATHEDATLMQPMRFGLGYMMSTDNRAANSDSLLIGEGAFGHVGMGGSVGFADPEAKLGFGYTMNRMGAGILVNERGQSLIDAAYQALEYRSNETGAWRR